MFKQDKIINEEYNYIDEDYKYQWQEGEKINLSTSVEKKKINGKDSFQVNLKGLPDDNIIEHYNNEDKKIFLKILNQQKGEAKRTLFQGIIRNLL